MSELSVMPSPPVFFVSATEQMEWCLTAHEAWMAPGLAIEA